MLKGAQVEAARCVVLTWYRHPQGIHIDGLELTPLASPAPAAKDDDFFSSWDKEKPKATATAPKGTSSRWPARYRRSTNESRTSRFDRSPNNHLFCAASTTLVSACKPLTAVLVDHCRRLDPGWAESVQARREEGSHVHQL